jgi:Nif-specific regulatory protein
VLDEKLLVRLGGSIPIATDARVIAATNQGLARMVGEKRFREDLFFRLNVVTLEIPPLRERGDDILLLARHFLGEFCQKARRGVPVFSAAATARLKAHPWPGNGQQHDGRYHRAGQPGGDRDAQCPCDRGAGFHGA